MKLRHDMLATILSQRRGWDDDWWRTYQTWHANNVDFNKR